MLVLSRKTNEAIRILDNISVTVLSVDGGVVKLGIEAPSDISIHRSEVYERIQEENRKAAQRPSAGMSALARFWQTQRKRDGHDDASRS